VVALPIIPALGRLRQEDLELELGLGYTAKPFQNKAKTNKKNWLAEWLKW
jgi:hypothetical protein